MQNIKIAFIGYGRHSRANLYPSIKLLGYKISAVATTQELTANKAKEEMGMENAYIDYKKMLEKEKPDCVFVCTQPHTQLQIVKDCLRANTHVFVEKNLGSNAKEAQEIADLADKHKHHVMVGFMKRFAPAYMMAKDYINKPEFGKLLSISQTFTSRSFVNSSSEYLLFAAIHYIDLIRYYMGEIVEVKGYETHEEKNFSQALICKASNGTTGSLYYVASPAWDVHVEDIYLTGSNGYVVVNGINKVRVHYKENQPVVPQWQVLSEKEEVVTTMASTGAGGLQNLYLNGFVGEIEHFLKTVESGYKPQNNEAENVKTMQLYDMLKKCIDQAHTL